MAVICVPMPPCFLGLPLRQMMLPLRGPLPVSSQMRAINSVQLKGSGSIVTKGRMASTISDRDSLFRPGVRTENGLGFPQQLPLSLARMNVNSFRCGPLKTRLLALSFLLAFATFPAVAADVQATPAGASAAPSTASVAAGTDAVANSVVKVFS